MIADFFNPVPRQRLSPSNRNLAFNEVMKPASIGEGQLRTAAGHAKISAGTPNSLKSLACRTWK